MYAYFLEANFCTNCGASLTNHEALWVNGLECRVKKINDTRPLVDEDDDQLTGEHPKVNVVCRGCTTRLNVFLRVKTIVTPDGEKK